MKKLLWTIGVVFALFLVALFLTPVLIQSQLQGLLRDQGVEGALIGDVDFNPFTEVLQIESIDFSGAENQSGTIETVTVNLRLMALFRKRVSLRHILIDSTDLVLSIGEDQSVRAGGLEFATSGSQPVKQDEPMAWEIGFDELEVIDGSVQLQYGQHTSAILVNELVLKDVHSWNDTGSSQLSLDAKVDDAGISIRVDGTPLSQFPEMEFQGSLRNFDLAHYQGFLQLPFSVAGQVTADVEGMLAVSQDSTLNYNSDSDISVENLSLSETESSGEFVKVEAIDVKELLLNSDAGIRLSSVQFESLELELERDEDGELRPTLAGNNSEVGGKDSAGAPAIEVGELLLSGDSLIRFTDKSLDTEHDLQVSIDEFTIRNVASDNNAELRLSAKLGEATFTAEGPFNVLGNTPMADIAIETRQLDLIEISPWLPDYHIERGRLTADSTVKLEGDHLELNNSLLIEKLKLSEVADASSAQSGDDLSMSLGMALDLLRDGDNNISLELPITGKLDDLQVGTADIINTAMNRAIKKAAVSYASNALQPLGAILFVANAAGKASRPRFQPVSFASGSAALSPDAISYLEKISEMLDKRPKLQLTFCGVSTAADLLDVSSAADTNETPPESGSDALQLELAQQRGDALQEYLVAEHGIDAKRLFRCRPTIDATEGADPRVEITL